MSEVKVNKISPRTACGTTTLGDSGDTFNVPCGSKINLASGGNLTVASGATITNNGTQTGFGRTGTVDWVTTVKVTGDSPITAVTGEGYFLNTTAGTITVNLPAGAAGSIVSMADYARTWDSNNVTVAANGSEKIGGVADDAVLNTEGQSVTFVYIDGTQGWLNVQDSTSNVQGAAYISATGGNEIATSGNYKMHIFTSPGTFCVASVATTAACNEADYLVVAGGGGGGGSPGNGAGGAGAGGLRATASGYSNTGPSSPRTPCTGVTLTASPYTVVVGGGGAGCTASPAPNTNCHGVKGVDSSALSITSTGGGYGGSGQPPSYPVGNTGGPGGSGGGGGGGNTTPNNKGTGNDPSVSPAQGMDGAPGNCGPNSGDGQGAGAGGFMVAGVTCNPGSDCGGCGGAGGGFPTAVVPASYGEANPPDAFRYLAGGGGAGWNTGIAPACSGSAGLGGGGETTPGLSGPINGAVNMGGGAAGGNRTCCGGVGGTGGSGIVIIRYKYQ